MSKTAIILALFLCMPMLGACGRGTGNTNTANANTVAANNPDPVAEGVKDNAEELGGLVKLPFEPEEVTWRESGQGTGKKLLAVIKFTPDGSKKVIERASKVRAATPVSLPSERWYPAELVALGELNGDDSLESMAYPADEFFMPPYLEGRLSHVANTDFFILELTAK